MNAISSSGSGNWSSTDVRRNATHLAVRTAYVGAGVGAAASIYRRLYNAIGDSLPAAIMTLLVVMTFLVVTRSKGDWR